MLADALKLLLNRTGGIGRPHASSGIAGRPNGRGVEFDVANIRRDGENVGEPALCDAQVRLREVEVIPALQVPFGSS